MAKRRKTPAEKATQEEREKYQHWMDEIKRAKKVYEPYFERGKKIVKLYKDDRPSTPDGVASTHRMNILWSNISVLQPAIYSRQPVPNVARRFLDKDPVSRTAALIIERNLQTALELIDFDYVMKRVRDDYLLVARGLPWVRYAPEIGMAPQKEPVISDGKGGYVGMGTKEPVSSDDIKEDDEIGQYYETEPVEQVLAYGLDVDHVLWSDWLSEPVNDWTKVGWVGKRAMMRRGDLKKLAPDKYRRVNLNKHFDSESGEDRQSGAPNCCEVWEILNKATRTTCWVTDGLPEELLREEQDQLKLQTFWPCPRPLLGTTTTDSMVPVPDYCLYQDQAEQIDKCTDRIRILTKALRVIGVYNSQSVGLQTLLEEGNENEMIPVDNWVWFSGTGGLKGNVDWFPIDQISQVLTQLFQARAQLRQDLYEVTGLSDILRGVSDPNATATAEQLKSNNSSLRLQDRQAEMSRIARDTLRKMAEVQCEHYPPEVLIEMSGVMESDEVKNATDPEAQQREIAKVQAAVQLIKSDKLRTFKIDIETDATVAPDQQKEKEARVEFLTAVAPFIEKAAQVGASAPQFVPLLLKMLDFGVRGFRTGRTLESAIEQTIDTVEKMQQAAEQSPQQQSDPAAEAQAAELQAKSQKAQEELAQAQAETQRIQAETSLKAQQMQERALKETQKLDLELASLKASVDKAQADNARAATESQTRIRLMELQIQEVESKLGAQVIQGMAPPPEQPQDPLAAERLKVEHAGLQVQLAQLQTDYAELAKRAGAVDGAASELGNIAGTAPAQLGTPLFGKPAKRTMKMHQIVRDDTGNMSGVVTHELPVDDDEEQGGEQGLPPQQPKPTEVA